MKSRTGAFIQGNLVEMDAKAAEYRGRYLQAISYIETTIDDTLADYFCGHDAIKEEEIMYVLFSSEKITLMNKYIVFMFLAERHCKTLYD